ncbi:hypothetical protein GALL_501580 [mine drainage metagenome]|uniref:Uncharacterized protein n=1 Tax=mine drainage metagenome TaxID=410659 RepID=A0A1J5PL07_9ZZZZ
MTSAILGIPVPGSPVINTLAEVRASVRTRSRNSSASAERPKIMRAAASPDCSARFSARFSNTNARVFNAFCTTASRSEGAQGFSRKSNAPPVIPRTAIGMSPSPVSKITGRSASTPRTRSSRAKPSLPGIRMSLTITPGKVALIWSFASI